MTSRILALSPRKNRAFTLAEMLTVVGILAVLIGILIPVINGARRSARRSAMQADLQTIASALDAYKADHGDYPRVTENTALSSNDTHPNPPTGAEVLCQALIAPLPAIESPIPANLRLMQDGNDGFGFRKRPGNPGPNGTWGNSDDEPPQGQVYGPYIRPDYFKLADPFNDDPNFANHAANRLCILPRGDNLHRDGAAAGDANWAPILYYPARPGKRDIRQPNAYLNNTAAAMFDSSVNELLFPKHSEAPGDALERLRFMMGDVNQNGTLEPDETPRFEGAFILWHPGFDAEYGPFDSTAGDKTKLESDDVNKMDDVTNFYP